MNYRWALIDRKGKTRMTCEATDYEAADLEFLKRRDGLGIPQFWQVVRRGPVDAMSERIPKTKASPAPYVELLAEAIRQSIDRAAKLQKALNYPGATWDQLIARAEGQQSALAQVMDRNSALKIAKQTGNDAIKDLKAANTTLDDLLIKRTRELNDANEKVARLEARNEVLDQTVAATFQARDAHRNALGLGPAESGNNGGSILDAILRMKSDLGKAKAERETIIQQKDALIETLREQVRVASERATEAFRERDAAHINAIDAHQKLSKIQSTMESDALAQHLANAFYMGASTGLEIMTPKG